MVDKQLIEIANYFLSTPKGIELLKKVNKGLEVIEEVKDKTGKVSLKKKDYKVKIEEFIVEGRIHDKLTQQPIEGVKIKTILGRSKKTKTNKEGRFKIKIKLPVIGNNNIVLSKPILYYSQKGYIPGTQELLTLNREVKRQLPTLNLLNINKAADKELLKYQNIFNNTINKINKIILSIPERVVIARKKSIQKIIDQIQIGLLPILLGLLIKFGITKLNQTDQKICPNPESKKDIINSRNRVTKQLNKFFKSLLLNTTIAAGFIIVANLFKSGKLSISSLPIPLGAPIGVGVPYTVVSKLQKVEDVFEKLEEENKKINKQILISLIFLVASLVFIVILLNQIDKLISSCYGEETKELMEEINPGLQELLAENHVPNFKPQFVNGFEINIIEEGKNVGSLTRRFASAKNKQGVVLLKGEVSFSADTQILIDELVFYIKNNELKAY